MRNAWDELGWNLPSRGMELFRPSTNNQLWIGFDAEFCCLGTERVGISRGLYGNSSQVVFSLLPSQVFYALLKNMTGQKKARAELSVPLHQRQVWGIHESDGYKTKRWWLGAVSPNSTKGRIDPSNHRLPVDRVLPAGFSKQSECTGFQSSFPWVSSPMPWR